MDREKLRSVLGYLNERERLVLELRFGLLDGHDYSLGDVGKKLSVTRERVRQLEKRALQKLKSYLE